ncbi:MAG: DUF1800 domain-containing protein [Betaproteobacteria bacterium]|nr:DUF1800 domain-containing protein [Betaproteobacteria bacterium]
MGLEEARHLLVRTTFGLTVPRIREFSFLSREQAIARLLAENRSEARTPPPAWVSEPVTPFRNFRNASVEERRKLQERDLRRGLELRTWWVGEMLDSPSQLNERMTLLWHGHFTSSQQKVRMVQLIYRQNLLLRRHATGNFAELLHAVSKDPAMLIYLDSASNRRGQPNENFAREVMELFTLGEGRYSEADIREAARAFTGWSIDPDSGEYLWRAVAHDTGEKTVLGQTGNFDGDAMLDILLAQSRTAEHIVEKLWREFVSQRPDPHEVQRIAAAFRVSRYDIKTALRELLASRAFWALENRGNMFKSPADLVVGTMRQFDIPVSDAMPLALLMAGLGQNLFSPPNVKGWPGGTRWINSSTLLARKQFIERLFNGDDAGATVAAQRNGFGDFAAAKGFARMAVETRERMSKSIAEMRFDSEKWLAHFPVTLAGDGEPVRRIVLAAEPAGGLPAMMANRELVRLLALDPVFQLK